MPLGYFQDNNREKSNIAAYDHQNQTNILEKLIRKQKEGLSGKVNPQRKSHSAENVREGT